MPIVPSGTISLLSLATEFGGSTPHSLSEYYRQPSGPVPRTETTVPTSGLISLSNFYGTEKVVPASNVYNSPGTYFLTVPAYNSVTMYAYGAGGGGGGSWYDAGFPGTAGSVGGDSYITIPGYGTMYGFGGGGGDTWLGYGAGYTGTASGGNNANTTGGGMGGGAGGVYGASSGSSGGTGGGAISVFTFGVTSGAPGQGVSLTIVVGTGGAGGFGQVAGSPGSAGYVQLTWS